MRIIIFDEKQEDADNLSIQIRKLQPEYEVRQFYTSFSLVTYIHDDVKGNLDVLFIDIIKGKDYIALSKGLQDAFPHIRVVFVSATEIPAQCLFEARPIFYLKKPIENVQLEKALTRISEEVNDEHGKLLDITMKGQIFRIRFNKIHYIESRGRKVYIYAQDAVREVNMPISEIQERLPSQFIQCHRCYIVNMNKVVGMNTDFLELSNRETIPISKLRYGEIKQLLMQNREKEEIVKC